MQKKFITMCCSFCILVPSTVNASAITVPPDVKDVAESAVEYSKSAGYRERFEQELNEAALNKQQIEKEMTAAWVKAVTLLKETDKNRALLGANRELLQHIQQDNSAYEERLKELEIKSRNAWNAAANAVNYAEALDNTQIEDSLGGEQVAAAYSYAANLQWQAENIDAEFEDAVAEYEIKQNKTELLLDARDELEHSIKEQENELTEAMDAVGGFTGYALESRAYYERLLQEKNNPYQDVSGFIRNNVYAWRGSGWSGSQFVQPYYFGYANKNNYWGLNFNYVCSENKTPGYRGKVNTFTDTLLYFSTRNNKDKYIVDYNLGINIPTGKASLSSYERNARMDEDLVRFTEFGEGWNFTPGIAVVRRLGGDKDLLTVGTSYSFRGGYDPTSDIDDDKISPGNEWQKYLRWQHAEEKWQFVGEILHTSSAESKISDGTAFDTGAVWETRLTYNRRLAEDQDLLFYYWYYHENNEIILNKRVEESPVHYFGTEWKKHLSKKADLRLTADVMVAEGIRYSSLTDSYVDDRKKVTFGIGCDFKIDVRNKILADIQHFSMHDGKNSNGDDAKKYHGFNFLTSFYHTF
ncbi:hypothetical protein [Phascolarctobacterium faecium]|uniref:hypothetical protein n=1 Tax=Phascolarctobacterium faecium TaxID=33025 RepID=UPI003AB5BA13